MFPKFVEFFNPKVQYSIIFCELVACFELGTWYFKNYCAYLYFERYCMLHAAHGNMNFVFMKSLLHLDQIGLNLLCRFVQQWEVFSGQHT